MYNLIELNEKILKWSDERGILTNGKLSTQALKLVSEVGELCDNVGKSKDIKDDIGDCLVVLTNLAALSGTTLEECGNVAYNDIKDRQGFLNANGNFIKSTDAAYTQLLAKHRASKDEVTNPLIRRIQIEQQLFGYEAVISFHDNSTKVVELQDSKSLLGTTNINVMALSLKEFINKPLSFFISKVTDLGLFRG